VALKTTTKPIDLKGTSPFKNMFWQYLLLPMLAPLLNILYYLQFEVNPLLFDYTNWHVGEIHGNKFFGPFSISKWSILPPCAPLVIIFDHVDLG